MSTPQPDAKDESPRRQGFVSDGYERAMAAVADPLLAAIREAVEAEFADELATAGPVRRLLIRRAMEQEIQRRYQEEIDRQAPPWALYGCR